VQLDEEDDEFSTSIFSSVAKLFDKARATLWRIVPAKLERREASTFFAALGGVGTQLALLGADCVLLLEVVVIALGVTNLSGVMRAGVGVLHTLLQLILKLLFSKCGYFP